MGAVSSKRIASETGELEKRARTNLPSPTLMSDMPHTKSHVNVNKERGLCIASDREPNTEVQKQHLLHQSQNSGIKCDSPESCGEEGVQLCKNENEKVSDISEITKDEERTTEKLEMIEGTSLPFRTVNGVPATQSDEQMQIETCQSGKVLEKLQPRRNPDADNPRPANHASMNKEEKVTNTKGDPLTQNFVQVSGQESYTYSTKFEKVEKLQPRRNPDPVVQESKSDVGTTPSNAADKALGDGYSWRKYGQKLVKGNKFVRSYYKCTQPNCQAKRQVERSHDGCKSDIIYLGNHHHQKLHHSPQVTSTLHVRTPETPISSTSKTNGEVIAKHADSEQHMASTETSPQSTVGTNADGFVGAVFCSNNSTRDLDCPDSKRLKRDTSSVDEHGLNKSNPESRHVVQTLSEVDLINDGYRWRKYGQKLVKGNPNPRSYYRCSNSGCPAKKHVERASNNPKLVITTYEGKHHHDIPTSRTISQSTSPGDANMNNPNGGSSSKPEDNSPVSREMAVHASAN